MPYQNIPEDPQEWQNAKVPRVLPSRAIRQLLIVDLPLFALIFYLPVAGLLLAPHLGLLFRSDSPASFFSLFIIWIRFILPSLVMLTCAYILLRTARAFVIELFRPSSAEDVENRIWNRLWGLHQLANRKFLIVNSIELDPPDHWSKWLGGPAYLVIYDGFAVYLEYGNRFRRVIGAGLPVPLLDTRETIKMIVDLRPQFREFDVNGWTKDGIKVILGVRVESRIGSDYSPEKADPKLLYPFDPLSVRRAVEYTAVRMQDGKLVEADWCEGAKGKIQGLLAHHISTRRLDELYLTDRGEEQVLSADVMKQLLEEANNGLKNVGIHVSNIQITKTQIPEDVYGQRLDVWKAGKDSVITRIQGEARAFEIRIGEEKRAQAQRDLILSITRSLGRIDPQQYPEATLLSLSKILDRGLKDPLVRGLMARETLLLLENLGDQLG